MTGFRPLQLTQRDRDLLNSLAFLGAEGRLLHPGENRTALTLEALGLARVAVDRAASACAGWGVLISHAALTPAGLRAARIGAGCGPRLVRLDGRPVAQRRAGVSGLSATLAIVDEIAALGHCGTVPTRDTSHRKPTDPGDGAA